MMLPRLGKGDKELKRALDIREKRFAAALVDYQANPLRFSREMGKLLDSLTVVNQELDKVDSDSSRARYLSAQRHRLVIRFLDGYRRGLAAASSRSFS